jgi:hypothetical protein
LGSYRTSAWHPYTDSLPLHLSSPICPSRQT